MSNLFRRDYSPQSYVMETVRPLEIPVIAQVKRLLSEDRFPQAVTLAYQTVLVDLQRTYRFTFPPHWTHKDVLQWTARNNLGLVTDLLARLYRAYEPIRYGTSADIVRVEILSTLTSIYAQSPLWRLYPLRASYVGSPYPPYEGAGPEEPRALPP